ncbi:hypothetical protein HN51_021617 [Arachis hypogaea]
MLGQLWGTLEALRCFSLNNVFLLIAECTTKVAGIEARVKNGYYIGHGLSSVKEDISRICRDAIKQRIGVMLMT